MAERIEGLSISIDMDTAALDRSMADIRRSFRALNSSIRVNANNLRYGERSVENYEKVISSLNDDIEKQRKNLEDLEKKHADAVSAQGVNSAAAQRLAMEYNKQADNLNRLERQLENAKREMAEFKRESELQNSTLFQAGKSLVSLGNGLDTVSTKIRGIGKELTKSITLPVTGAVTAIGGMVAAFGWGRLVGVDNARAQLEGMGYTAKEVEEISKEVSEAITGGMMTMDEGISVAAGALAAGVEQGKELEKYIKLVDAAAVGAGSSVPEMAMIFNRVQGSGKMMTQELNMIEDRMPGFSQTFADHLGVSLEEFRKMVTDGKVSSEDFLDVMESFAGGMADAYAGTWQGMLANTKANIGKIGESLLGGVFEQSKESIREFLELLRSDDLKAWAENAGQKISEVFTRIVENIKGAVQWFSNLDAGKQKLIGTIGAIAVSIGPLLTILGVMGNLLGSISKGLGTLFQFLTPVLRGLSLKGGLAGAFTALVNPVGLVVTGIAALTAGLVYAYQKSETFRETMNKVKDAIMNGIGIAIDYFKGKIEEIKLFWDENGEQILQAFKNVFSLIAQFVIPRMEQVKQAFETVIPLITEIFKRGFELMLSITKNIWNAIKGIIDGTLNIIKGVIQVFTGVFTLDFQMMWEGIKSIFSGALEILWSIIELAFKNILSFIKTIMSDVSGFLSSIWETIKKTVVGFTSGIWNDIRNKFTDIKNGAINLTTQVKDGIIKRWKEIKSSVATLAKELWETVKKRFDEMVKGAKELPGKIGNGIRSMARKAVNGVVDVANDMGSKLENGINAIIDGINSVLSLVGVDEAISKVKIKKIPAYKDGTDGHKGGLAVVGDGGMSELIRTPDGREFLSPDKPTLVDMPKGTQVLNGPDTKKILPFYKEGTTSLSDWLRSAWSSTTAGIRGLGSLVKEKATDFMIMAFESGKKVIERLVEASGFKLPNGNDFLSMFARGSWKTVIDALASVFDKKIPEFAFSGSGSSEDVRRWIAQAIAITGVPASWQGALETIAMHESGGNPTVVNTWDINARRGTPSIGLMQTIGPTFDAYKLPGLDDIRNPVHNAVAAIRYIQARYGTPFNTPGIRSLSRGGPYKGYAKGGRVPYTQWALVGEEGPELVRLPGGSEVLSHEESVMALSQQPQYSAKKLTDSIMDVVKRGIKEADNRADVDIMSLINQGAESAWRDSPARSNIQKIRDIREQNIRLLEREIELLKEEAATEKDLILLNEKQAELDHLRAKKAVEYQNKIRDEEALLKAIEQAHKDGLITQTQYNRASAEMIIRINDLKHEADDFNRVIGEEQRRALEESERRMKEYAEQTKVYFEEMRATQAQAFSYMSSSYQQAYRSAMEEQRKELQERHKLAIELFNKETQAHERAIEKQIEDIARLRDERIQSIQNELDAMDEEDRLESRAEQEEAWDKERTHLERRLVLADFMNDAKTYEAVLQEIADFEKTVEKQRREWEREDKREELLREQDRIRNKYNHLIKEKELEIQNYRERRELQLEDLRQRQEAEELAFNQKYERQQERFEALAEQLAAHIESGRMTQEQANRAWLQAIEDTGIEEIKIHHENQERVKEALNEYVEEYINIGKSYGDGLIDGLTGALKDGLSTVKSTMGGLINSISSSGSGGSSGGSSSPPRGGGWTIPSDPNHDSRTAIERVRDDLRRRMGVYHDGGWVGKILNLKTGEIPAILQEGEFVLSHSMLDSFKNMLTGMYNVGKMVRSFSYVPVPGTPHNATDNRYIEQLINKLDNFVERSGDVHIYLDGKEMTDIIMTRATNDIKTTSRKGG